MGEGYLDLIPQDGAFLVAMAGAAAAALMLIAGAWDLATREIPNRASAGVALAALPSLLAQPGAASLATLAVAAVLFGLGVVAFRFGLVGGGDVKLLGAVGLWINPLHLGLFLTVQAAVTLLLAGALLLRPLLRAGKAAGAQAGSPRTASLPFGVPIAAGGLAVLLARTGLIATGAS